LKKVPDNWIKISGTKAVSRFHTPFIIGKTRERDQHRDRLRIASQNAYKDYLHQVSEKYEIFRDIVQRLAQLDCLLSLASVAIQPGYCKPEYVDHLTIKVENGRHPMVEQLLSGGFVPNDVDFDVSMRLPVLPICNFTKTVPVARCM
jgi:DNA mismatch repair protein MSH3